MRILSLENAEDGVYVERFEGAGVGESGLFLDLGHFFRNQILSII